MGVSSQTSGRTSMKKTSIIIISAFIIIMAGAAGYAALKPSANKAPATASESAGGETHGSPHTHDDSHPHDEPSADADAVQSGTVAMDIKNFDFEKQTLKVKAGTTVTWTNRDDAKHDVNPDQSSSDFEGSGKLLAQGESYSYTFQKPGTYTYHCTPHPYMKASVEVVE